MSRALAARAERWLGASWSWMSRAQDRRLRSAIVHEETYRPFERLPEVSDPTIAAHFAGWRDYPFRARLYDLRGPVWIEPSRGYVVAGNGLLVNASIPYWELFRPSIGALRACLAARVHSRECAHFDTVVSMRTHDDGNYYHFYDDFLGRLRVIQSLGLDSDVPFLVGGRLYRAAFFQDALRRGKLRDINWLVHDRVVSANRIVCGHTGSLRVENFRFARDMLAVRPPSRDPARRLFLTRAPARGRTLRNEREVAAMLERFGFETVDTDACSLDEQIALFAGARALVAVHGAGIVNAQFRWPRPFTLVELFPPWYVHPPFAWMAQQLGWGYGAICGSRADASDSFVVDVDDLRDRVDAALAQPGSATGRADEELEVS